MGSPPVLIATSAPHADRDPRTWTLDHARSGAYFPKLDGLRAISIAFVLIEHFLWNGYGFGGVGVTIFFVISGYLITSILISYSSALPVRQAALTFYWRRMLRLFPIYYLCIAVTAALNVGGMRDTWLVNVLYLMNVKVALNRTWNGSSHFWSLAVEEQFYLLWFLAVVVAPRRRLLSIICLCIVIGPLWRGTMFWLSGSGFTDMLLPGVMDSMAVGALLAYALSLPEASRYWEIIRKVRISLLLVSLGLIIAVQHRGTGDLVSNVFLRSLWGLFSTGLVAIGIDRQRDWRFDWLGNKALRHFGKISYGIYVYHYFLPAIINAHWLGWASRFTVPAMGRFLVIAGTSCLIAELSWRLIEQPIMKLKDKSPFGIQMPIPRKSHES
jgi:peptidoglycan/LPS O-acetylase OafA/YrhL